MTADLFMAVRLIILSLYTVGGAFSLYVVVAKKSWPAVALFTYCVNAVAFTTLTVVCALGILCVDVYALNMWSGIVRMHGGFTLIALSIYFYVRRFP